jgi:hypothetical protein
VKLFHTAKGITQHLVEIGISPKMDICGTFPTLPSKPRIDLQLFDLYLFELQQIEQK